MNKSSNKIVDSKKQVDDFIHSQENLSLLRFITCGSVDEIGSRPGGGYPGSMFSSQATEMGVSLVDPGWRVRGPRLVRLSWLCLGWRM